MKETGLTKRSRENDTWCSLTVTGRTGIPKICIRDFECWHCPFYYWLEEFGETPVCDEYSGFGFLQMQAA